MKRNIIIIVVAVALVVGMILEQIYINDCINGLTEKTDYVYDYIHQQDNINSESFIQKVEELDKYWKERENVLCLVINHKEMEKVGEQITKLTALVKQNDKEQAEYEVELLKYYVEGYEHIMCVTFQNIW